MKGNQHFHGFNYYREAGEQFTKTIEENREYFEAEVAVDLGAGGGTFSKPLSKYVGKLYSIDVSEDAIEAMKKNLAGLKNIEIVKIEETRMPFAASSIDLVFAANSFHDLPKGYEKEINRVLKRGGRFIDIDWKNEPTEFGPPLSIRLSEQEVKSRLETHALKEVKSVDIGTHYMLIFLKS
jgi:ubiquinone/menaquinone biosynthesis C-methylase UbiE